ncbi:MAG: phosphoribosylanthranilate isomerase [Lachnospiraceae bacterium]|nr:phosphoribosylanthranilate isomerase [Lachnospiraceae bacterium]
MTKVKICGLKTLADVEKVNRYLPEYIGFVFADTKRFVTDEQALRMRKALDKRIQAVGVFINEPMEHIVELCDRGVINAVQLHGEESEDYIRELRQETDTTVIKAVKVQSVEPVLKRMSQEADYMLFDTYKKGEPGGTGERFSLDILKESLKKLRVCGQAIKPYFLAGGLHWQNVTEVLGQMECNTFRECNMFADCNTFAERNVFAECNTLAECIAVDVSTGVETDGIKDEKKIRQFIENVRNMNKVRPL